jgi:translation initiation factor IF-2
VKKQGDEIISARAERLTGPKVIGKIELPSARPSHKPVASSSNAGNNNEKRKRKRTNPNGPVNPNAGQGQGHNNQHRGPRDGNNPNNRTNRVTEEGIMVLTTTRTIVKGKTTTNTRVDQDKEVTTNTR